MKVAFITTIYRIEEKQAIKRLKAEIDNLGLSEYRLWVHNGISNNRGYAYGVNQGIKKARQWGADLIVIINPDISFNQITGKDIINVSNKFDISGFSHHQNQQRFYGGEIDRWRATGGLISQPPAKRFIRVDFVSGSFIIIRRKVIETIGDWDESYFLYYDEVDFCRRAVNAGFTVGIDSQRYYHHFELSKTNPKKEYFLIKSRWRFFWRYANRQQRLYELLRLPLTITEIIPKLIYLTISSQFLTNFFSLNLSSLIIKLLYFVFFIFLVRYLTAAEYGVYNLVWAHVGLLAPFLDFGTTTYGIIYLPARFARKFSSIFSLRIILAGLVFFSTIGLALIANYSASTKLYIILTSVVIFSNMASGSYLIINSVRQKAYYSAIVSIIFNCILISYQLITLITKKQLGLIFWNIFFLYNIYLLVNLILVRAVIKTGLKLEFSLLNWLRIIQKSYVFVLIGFFAGLYFKLDIFLLNFFKGTRAVGVYSAGYNFFEGLTFIVASYNITATPILVRLAKAGRHGLHQKIKKDIILLLAISVPLAVVFAIFAPLVLPILVKQIYPEAIPVAQIVVFALPLMLLSSVFINSLYALDKAKLVIIGFAIQTVVNFCLNLIFIPRYSFFAAAYITVLSEWLNLVFFYYLFARNQ